MDASLVLGSGCEFKIRLRFGSIGVNLLAEFGLVLGFFGRFYHLGRRSVASFRNFDYFCDFNTFGDFGDRFRGFFWLRGGDWHLAETFALQEAEVTHGTLEGAINCGEVALDGIPNAFTVVFSKGVGDAEESVFRFGVRVGNFFGHLVNIEIEEGGFDRNDAIATPFGVDHAINDVGFDAVERAEAFAVLLTEEVEIGLIFPVMDDDDGGVESVGCGVFGGGGLALGGARSGGEDGVSAVGGDARGGGFGSEKHVLGSF